MTVEMAPGEAGDGRPGDWLALLHKGDGVLGVVVESAGARVAQAVRLGGQKKARTLLVAPRPPAGPGFEAEAALIYSPDGGAGDCLDTVGFIAVIEGLRQELAAELAGEEGAA